MPLSEYEVQFAGFDRLMPHRVREILLVASPYDAFIIAESQKKRRVPQNTFLYVLIGDPAIPLFVK